MNAAQSLNRKSITPAIGVLADSRARFSRSPPSATTRLAAPANMGRWTLKRVEDGFTGFFGRIKRGLKPGFPRFKPVSRWNTFGLLEAAGLRHEGDRIRLKGFDRPIRLNHDRALPSDAKILGVTFTRKGRHRYVGFTVETNEVVAATPPAGEAVGGDLGVEALPHPERPTSLASRARDPGVPPGARTMPQGLEPPAQGQGTAGAPTPGGGEHAGPASPPRLGAAGARACARRAGGSAHPEHDPLDCGDCRGAGHARRPEEGVEQVHPRCGMRQARAVRPLQGCEGRWRVDLRRCQGDVAGVPAMRGGCAKAAIAAPARLPVRAGRAS